ncbi:ornithine carbamoyltransferase [Shimazuella sp. AN120528]|uniref:ornithine carbamoyltransferase n=1 Tax=Shimazuella soli TaxID=1892854 RepID=UPI001F0FAD57|nr:ornithine carbamoyltransferase [Shimazuella soli]MCH5585354.1 ornithine carbamoyltransferase [Shimazuella soli]
MATLSIPSPLKTCTGKSLLTLTDFAPDEITSLLSLAHELKKLQKNEIAYKPLTGKTLAMIFDKPSTRTRVSFEVGMVQLGGHVMNLNRQDIQLGRGETVEDTAKVLSRYIDGILIRTYDHETVDILAKTSTVPVINGLTDYYHPCQALADLLTLQEEKGYLTGLKVAYVGDGNNVLHSLMHGAAATGVHLSISTPAGYEPNLAVWKETEILAAETGASITFYTDPLLAVQEADAVYTDVWASMGQEEEKEKRLKDFAEYQVNQAMMDQAKEDAIFLHCLPAYRELEVTAEVLDGPQSVVFNQAENRLHAQKALLVALLGEF